MKQHIGFPLKPALKVAVSLSVLALLFQIVRPADVWFYFMQAKALPLSAGVLLFFGCNLLQARRWAIICANGGQHLPLGLVTRLIWVGHFFSQVLPSTVGGDVVRLWHLTRLGIQARDALASIVADRIFGILVVALMVLSATPWLLATATSRPEILSVLFLAGAVLTVGTLICLYAHAIGLMLEALSLGRLAAPILATGRIGRDTFCRPMALFGVLFYSVLSNLLLVSIVSLIALSIGIKLSLLDGIQLIPAVLLVSAIPVSVAGWGLREGAMIVALQILGITSAHALTISILFGLLNALASLPGAFLWWSLHRHASNP